MHHNPRFPIKFSAENFAPFGILAIIAAGTTQAQAQINYAVLGDSYAYGYTTPTTTGSGNGDPAGGYFTPFAAYLAAQSAKTVNVTNIAEPGETTGSFGTPGSLPSPNLNTSYTGSPAADQSQEAMLKLNAQTNVVTLQIGGNDAIDYLYQTIYAQQQAPNTSITSPTLVAAANNVGSILQGIKTLAPNATIYLIDYADPFAALNSMANPTADGLLGYDVSATQNFDSLLASQAQTYGARFVDISQLFSTNPNAANYYGNDFYINNAADNTSVDGLNVPDFHPTSLGYAAIAQQIENTASAPEPDSLALVGWMSVLCGILFAGTKNLRVNHRR